MSDRPHALLSPSSAHRWLRCPGSVAATRDAPRRDTVYSLEGTAGHALAATCRLSAAPALGYTGQEIEGVEVTTELAAAVQAYLDYLEQHAWDREWVEVRLPIDWITGEEGATGTADHVGLLGQVLHVTDLKLGRGVRVEARDNPQLALYALGALDWLALLFDIEQVVMTVHQPRLDHVDSWVLGVVELRRFGEQLVQGAAYAREPDAPRIPGDVQCRFCDAKATCEALRTHVVTTIADTAIDDQRIAEQLNNVDLVRAWATAVEDRARELALEGWQIPGWKLVEARTNRKWVDDEKTLRRRLRAKGIKVADVYEKRLRPIGEVEADLAARFGRERAAQMLRGPTTKPQGQPVLVKESDRREPINLAAHLGLTSLAPLD